MDVLEPRFRWVLPGPRRGPGRCLGRRDRHGLLGPRGRPAGRAAASPTAPPSTPSSASRSTGSTTPRSCPTPTSCSGAWPGARDQGERVLVFGDFDADGLTGLAILVLALGATGSTVEPYVPSRLEEGHGLSIAALDARRRPSGATVIVTVDCGTTSDAEIAEARRRGHRRHRHGPPPRPAGPAARPSRSSTRIGRTRAIPDRRLAGSGVAFKVAQLAAGGPARRTGRGPRARRPRDDRDRRGRRADRRREPGHRPARASSACATAPRPGIAALLERAERRAGRGRPRDRRRSPSRRGSTPPVGWGRPLEAARLLLADGRRRGRGPPRRRARGGQPDAARPA